MGIGDVFSTVPPAQFAQLLALHGITVTSTRTTVTPAQLDVFGEPTSTPATAVINVTIIVESQEIIEKPTEAGGRNQEQLQFFTQPNQVQANDEITYNGFVFKVADVIPQSIGGIIITDVCVAVREVE